MTFEHAESFYRKRVDALVRERRRLQDQGSPASRLEQNRVALNRAQWQLERAVRQTTLQQLRADDRGGARARTGVAEPPSLRDAAFFSPSPADMRHPETSPDDSARRTDETAH